MPPGPNQGGSGKGPLIAVVIAAIVVVGGIIATLVVVLGGDDDKKTKASPTTSGSSSASASADPSRSASPTSRPSTSRPAPPTRSSRPTSSAGEMPSEVEYVDLSKGECVNLGATGDIDKTSCSSSHDGEVVHTYNLTGSTYPGEDAISTQTESKCGPVFDSAVSGRSDASQLTFNFTFPKQPGWDLGRRKVTCIAQYKSGQKLTKPLR